MTKFSDVYNRFLDKITDDMYMVLTPEDTVKDLQHLLINAIPGFEFPRKRLDEYRIDVEEKYNHEVEDGEMIIGYVWNDLETDQYPDEAPSQKVIVDHSYFEADLTAEEINILAILMLEGWVQRQVTSIENTRMKYSGTDFKMTSQANHLAKLLALLSEIQRQSLHMQRLYKRRRTNDEGQIESNWDVLRHGVYDAN